MPVSTMPKSTSSLTPRSEWPTVSSPPIRLYSAVHRSLAGRLSAPGAACMRPPRGTGGPVTSGTLQFDVRNSARTVTGLSLFGW